MVGMSFPEIPRGPKRSAEANLRANAMCMMYTHDGYTMQEIGDVYRITLERVRQILRKFYKVTHKDSLRHKAILDRRSELRAAELFSRAKKTGMSVEDYLAWREMVHAELESGVPYAQTVEGRYIESRRNWRYQHHGIESGMTRMEWFRLWQDSGHYAEYGRGADHYMMGRIDRHKGFVPGNVIIRSAHDNSVAERVFKSEETKTNWLRKGKKYEATD